MLIGGGAISGMVQQHKNRKILTFIGSYGLIDETIISIVTNT